MDRVGSIYSVSRSFGILEQFRDRLGIVYIVYECIPVIKRFVTMLCRDYGVVSHHRYL